MSWLDIVYDEPELSGNGIFDFITKPISNFFKPELSKYPKDSQKIINEHGNYPIVALNIYRTPLQEFNNKLVNIISLGSYDKIRKELGKEYDKMYHLALVASVRDPNNNIVNVIIEKHARINISTNYKTNAKTEIMPVNLEGKNITINDMTESVRKSQGDNYYFAYSAMGGNNCQNYVLNLLKSIRLLTPEIEKFVYQDITPIIEKIAPHTKSVSDFITNFWAWKDKLIGNGVPLHEVTGGKGLFIPDDNHYHYLAGGKGLFVPTDKYYHYLAGGGARPFNTGAFSREISGGSFMSDGLKKLQKIPKKDIFNFLMPYMAGGEVEEGMDIIY